MRFRQFAPHLAFVLVSALASGGALAAEDLPGNPAAGKEFALGVCAECHVVAEDQGTWPLSDAPPFREVANAPGMTELALRAFLQTPHRTMPNILLSPEETDNVIAYILTLKAPD